MLELNIFLPAIFPKELRDVYIHRIFPIPQLIFLTIIFGKLKLHQHQFDRFKKKNSRWKRQTERIFEISFGKDDDWNKNLNCNESILFFAQRFFSRITKKGGVLVPKRGSSRDRERDRDLGENLLKALSAFGKLRLACNARPATESPRLPLSPLSGN